MALVHLRSSKDMVELARPQESRRHRVSMPYGLSFCSPNARR